jgi:hypothetical protein
MQRLCQAGNKLYGCNHMKNRMNIDMGLRFSYFAWLSQVIPGFP